MQEKEEQTVEQEEISPDGALSLAPVNDTAQIANDETNNTTESCETTDDNIAENDETAEEIGCGCDDLAQTDDDGNEEAISESPVSAKASGGSITVKKWHLAIAAVLMVCLLVGGVLFGMWLSRGEKDDVWGIDPNAKDYDFSHGNAENASADNIAIPGYSQILIPADTQEVQVVLLNPKGNPCYFRFTLILKDSSEAIYTSGLVPPGQAVSELTLIRALKEGEYPLVIQIETFSLTDRTPMNGANVETVLTVR